MKIWITTASATEMDIIKPLLLSHLSADSIFTVGGVGLVATAIHATKTISTEKPDLALQIGIAGAFGDIPLGSASLIESDCIGDQGVWEENQFNDCFALNLSNGNNFPYQANQLINETAKEFQSAQFNLASSVSVNQITTDPQMIDYYQNKLQVQLESMEGAAFHWACLTEKIPFLQIRGVSNTVGERNKQHWKIKEALEVAASTTLEFIQTYRSNP